jgi:hypothetical protein
MTTSSQSSRSLERRLAQMERALDEQQRQITQQREHIIQQDARQAQQDAEIERLRSGSAPILPALPDDAVAPATTNAARQRSRPSRRALLKLGGAAAAAGVAATAALMASEGGQTAHAADNGPLNIGQANLGTSQTSLAITGSSSATPFFAVNASGSTNGAAWAIKGISDVMDGIGVGGTSTGINGIGVYGSSNSSTANGMYGNSTSGTGVSGNSSSGTGVSGASTNGFGVNGFSTNYVAVNGFSSNSVGGWFQGGRAALTLGQGGAPGAPAANFHNSGDIYLDSLATVWVCVGTGTPGIWVRLGSVPNGTPGGTIQYLSTPIRLLDARTSASSGLVNRGALAGNEVYPFGVAGLGGIPSDAQGLIGNVTILGPSGAGNLSLFPAGGAVPTVASMTFGSPGLFLANGVNVAIGSGGAINIQNQSSGTTPLVLDAVAYVS